MSTTTTLTTAPRPHASRSAMPRGLRGLLVSESRLMLRNPALIAWVAAIPVIASIVLGALPATREPRDGLDGLSWFAVYQPILIMFSAVLLSVQILPDVLTRYREMGILKRLRTTPASPTALLAAQVILAVAVEIVVAAVMVFVPAAFGAPLPRDIVGFAIAFVFSTGAMLAIGMVLASAFRNSKVAGAVGTVLFFVLQFFAGLWIPRATMPGWLRGISDATPTGAAVGALTDGVDGAWPQLLHLGVLAVWMVVLAAVSVRIFRWE
ncbi:ABC transporter permease [Williamsia phyllosphaerae]|uniref:Transport permease protein n=1 Tax=Williamsia phyllosphaerae TaxID=885042 RepID=A0ABQ1UGS0_9NOCA|nr:ABC transporter permease [Williamsia phyllosphaerae]GGF18685.1 transport permease protein [Williamsia phyllosphaerae]